MTDATAAFTPIKLGPITLRNRFIKAGANEGMTPHGMPTKALVKNHRDFAAGGVGMTTVAYGSVSVEGLTFAHQFCVNAESVPHLRVLTDAVHAEGAAACLQITHAGAFTQIRLHKGWTPGSASGGFNKSGMLSGIFSQHAMDEAEMDKVAGEFVEAAKLAREAGFDAVEIHMGHGYLLNQFLSPLDNKRNDAYGGDAHRRATFPAMVLKRVKDAVGDKLAVTAKINVFDGAKGGATGEDAAVLARVLEAAGADLLTLSGGRNVEAPWALFGSPMPIADLKARSHGFVQWFGFFMVGMLQPKNIKFHEMYFLEHSRKVRAATRMPLSFIGGVKSMENIGQAMSEGFDCISLARVLIHDPDFINKLKAGTVTKSGCTSCNRCVAQIYAPGGTACVLGSANDPALNLVLAAS
jgi:2,4-dienoyl-CoA reductase-like NADH-dependent reductase (Old Yellow Enzyme family)